MHAYEVIEGVGHARYFVENKSKGGLRPTTIKDCRANNWLPSPTEILKTLAKPALTEWLIRTAVTAFATASDIEGENLDDRINRVLDVEKQQDAESKAAMDLGTRIHEAIELKLADMAWACDMDPYIIPVCEQVKTIGRVVSTENILVNTTHGYAGRTDCICDDGNALTILDFKTCKNIPKQPYDEHKLQIASYCAAVGNTGDQRVKGALVYISTTKPGEIKVCESVDWESDFTRFKLLLQFWKLSNNFI